MRASSVTLRAPCPYCEYGCSIDARNICGELFVLRCVDCREVYVVDVSVVTTHRVLKLADVDPSEVLDRLGRKAPAAPAPTARSRKASLLPPPPKVPLKVRRQPGQRYGPDAPGDP